MMLKAVLKNITGVLVQLLVSNWLPGFLLLLKCLFFFFSHKGSNGTFPCGGL